MWLRRFELTQPIVRKSCGFMLMENILGKPSAPEGPLEVKDVTKTSCKLSWKKPEDDGGLPIKEYEIEKMDVETGKWVRVGKVAADVPGSPGFGGNPETVVTGLNPNSEYKFRVKAVNDEGDSEPLTTTKSVVAKNPYGRCIEFSSFFFSSSKNK